MCDVPSIAVFCSESIECFPGTAFFFFFLLLLLYYMEVSFHRPFLPGTSLVTSGDPQRSRFKFHTAVLSVLCVLFQVVIPLQAQCGPEGG